MDLVFLWVLRNGQNPCSKLIHIISIKHSTGYILHCHHHPHWISPTVGILTLNFPANKIKNPKNTYTKEPIFFSYIAFQTFEFALKKPFFATT